MNFKDVKTIYFDYDGTIHNSIKIYGPAFRKAYKYLVEMGLAQPKNWTDKEISYWLGFNPKDMWNNFMPQLDSSIKDKCSQIIGGEMQSLIRSGRPQLYDGALETLKNLKDKGYTLVFISNCKISYRDTHKSLFNLDNYFDRLICSEEYGFIPKHEILARVKDSYPKKSIIVGDRFQDMEAGFKNEIWTIGCSYGFALEGELRDSDLIIDNIVELQNLL